MKKFKILLDLIMTVFMILLMKLGLIPLKLHEAMGILIFSLFLIHKIINFNYFKTLFKNISNRKMKFKNKFLVILDILLFIVMFVNVISGILISRELLPNNIISDIFIVTKVHKIFALLNLILISIHIGLHIDRFIKKSNNFAIKIVILILYLFFAVLGIKSLINYSIYNKIFVKTEKQQSMFVSKKETKYTSVEKIPTLEDYLKKFRCGGCRRDCLLSNPGCGRGWTKREEKEEEYYKLYSDKLNEEESEEDEEDISLPIEDIVVDDDKTSSEGSDIVQNPFDDTITDQVEDVLDKYKEKNKTTVFDGLYIMILFVGGTYYITNNPWRKKKEQ